MQRGDRASFIHSSTCISFSRGQQNLIIVFHNEANTALIMKIALKFFWSKYINLEKSLFSNMILTLKDGGGPKSPHRLGLIINHF